MSTILHKLMADAGELVSDIYEALIDLLEGERPPPAQW